ncbi:cytochrome b5-like Heme/Steroid binding domain-containing protein [Sodiomyces alkalinus F11]|uniref:stearoyl-CoA 9-desaturase n=1 Tax=Sodiomyces alkalinus (strain CBS 110278 / VKM F-3762 / F11) TaxID=1314773 RepID=A0A3N2PVW3_SODAK|nr:cytochrome b5-like Heme/Steroid binding domain-containing protein [Sodiomyces alkalinus F11]ROT38637.1 cytochrome b5-like Heme/Steroid binding domain-containing protein [Sodiomyces alkalinus F11]
MDNAFKPSSAEHQLFARPRSPLEFATISHERRLLPADDDYEAWYTHDARANRSINDDVSTTKDGVKARGNNLDLGLVGARYAGIKQEEVDVHSATIATHTPHIHFVPDPFALSGPPTVHLPKNKTMVATTASKAAPEKWDDGTTDYVPARKAPVADNKKPHVTTQPITWSNWWQHVNWLNITLIVFVPIIGLIGSYWVPLHLKTAIFAVVYYFHTGLGITAGYHRLWAHRSYAASLPLRIYLAAVGAGAVEGSIRWWARGHRAHHRYTDTDKDPYSVRKGLLYSHIGWMVMKQDPKRVGRADITDLNEDPVVMWQHIHYLKCVIGMGLVFPTVFCGLLWGDWLGGYVYGGILRIFFVQQATFCVNSLAHWLGDQPFDDRNSPRDHVVTALVTLGEGYHNFHHEFPSDYRNAIEWYQYDPTKWAIWCWKKLGLASNLKQFRSNEIEKGRVQQLQKRIDQKRATLDWGVPLEQLPVVAWDDFVAQAKDGKALVAIAGVIHDVTDFIKEHPGGKALISSGIGKDATGIFNGGVYNHSNAAHNLLSTMRVGVLRGGCEVEIWKRTQFENKDMTPVTDSAGQRIFRAGDQVTRLAQPIKGADAA